MGATKHRLRLPFGLQVAYGSRRFSSVFAFVLAAFTLFGPITPRNADHNAYRYLLGPFACTLVALAMHLLFRFNPYRWNRYRDRRLSHLDDRDEDARRLVEIVATPGYVQTALKATAWLAVPWFLVMAGCTLWRSVHVEAGLGARDLDLQVWVPRIGTWPAPRSSALMALPDLVKHRLDFAGTEPNLVIC